MVILKPVMSSSKAFASFPVNKAISRQSYQSTEPELQKPAQ
ncbi:hypothetical protein VCR29J2_410118 [Vibrio coralliirubri]|nr:hypothetical protein VCR29J2_410118 [Vibrio coralliirubri]